MGTLSGTYRGPSSPDRVEPRRTRPVVRHLAAVAAAVTVLVATASAAAATPRGGGTSGDPQPELALFNAAAGGVGAGSGTVLPNGNLVFVATTGTGISPTTATVCVLHPGDRSCAWTVTLHAYHGDSFGGTPEVLSIGNNDISIALEDCCYIRDPSGGGAVVFYSSNGGKTFSSEEPAGYISSIGAATYAGGQDVVGTYTTGQLYVQAFAPNPSSATTGPGAKPRIGADGTTGLSTYDNGVLVASDNTTNTYVEYAPSGSNFNSSKAYHSVGSFSKETVFALSGNALLTDVNGSLTGAANLRFFNGSSFGPAHRVPIPSGSDDGYFAMQDVGGTVHIFFENRRNSYDIYSETTQDGVHWSAFSIYNTAITSAQLVPVLGSIGSGVCFEAESKPLYGQPILDPQSVSVSLKSSTVKEGTSTTLNGKGSPTLKGETVTLERLSGGLWYNVSTTKESSSGTFSFTIPGETDTYRAVVNYDPGYYLYGYSNSVTLTATKS